MHRFRARFRRDTSRRDVAPHLPTPQLVPDTEQAQFSPETPLSTPSFPDGVKLLHDCSDATVDICFVHGLTGDRVSTWAPNGQSNVTPWPKTLLPPRLPKARILTYGYDAYVVRKSVASSNRLIDHAANLLTDLSTDRAQCNASTRPIIFVAHSLGGLVCKRAIISSRNNPEPHLRGIFDCTKGIIFMGTPHKGASMADWAKVPVSALGVVKSINKSLLQILETDNQLLESIQNDFWSMIRESQESGRRIEVTCFFEELPMPGVGKVVSKESATLEGYASISIHANHRDMVRFNSAEDNGFLRLLGELTRWQSQVSSTKVDTEPPSINKTESPSGNESVRNAFYHHGSGSMNVSMGSGPQNNNIGSGYQFNGPIHGLQLHSLPPVTAQAWAWSTRGEPTI